MSFLAYPSTTEQKELLALAGELADIFAQRASEHDWEGRFPVENFKDLQKAGYLSLSIPRDLGGQGASLLDLVHAQYRLAQGDASTALVACMHLMHIGRLVEDRTEHPEPILRLCQDVIEHGAMINSAVSEPATGSPSRGGRPQTTAYRQPDGSWQIRGRKNFTTGSHALSYFIVGCSIEDQAGTASGLAPLTAERGNFLVPSNVQGVSIEDTWNTVGMRGSGSNDLILDDVHISPESYLDVLVPTEPSIQTKQGVWGLVLAAGYLGIAQAARDEAIRFAQTRRPNSLKQSIATVPHIQDKLGKIEVLLLESQAVLFGLAEHYTEDNQHVDVALIGAAKYLAVNNAIQIIDLAMRVVGAASLALTSPLQRYYRDIRAGLHNPPMDDVALSALAKRALGPEVL
ncbi:acyl-CoA dehydrogenase family protein [Dictyobacter arantiisoli]|uniref:Putative acyl-CoA dehydrogenase YdbM n=1 Tax=Dictyobacter arantiisoli TaxID=2014874 RepID=A0A5A5TDZ6_9CHLR|nr:acyl-CoA dehydrogenase family protein [Dictyobacter arantiisoli]GCF09114.1 putative acyl-CoA dehydrogenase YdbM [Dictyobacter arantiisoli]